MNCQDIDRNITPIYMAFMLELERQRLARGLSMAEVNDHAGIADGLYGKSLYASSPSGRQSNWRTIQDLVDALFPAGFDLIVKPKSGLRLDPSLLRCKIKSAAAIVTSSKSQRELMSELGKKSGQARKEKFAAMTEEERKRAVNHIVRKARKTRKRNALLRLQAARSAPPIERVQSRQKPCVVTTASAGPSCTVGAIGSPAE